VKLHIFDGDLGVDVFEELRVSGIVSCDSETTGLDWHTEKLGLFQIYNLGVGVVLLRPTDEIPTKLITLVEDASVEKIFHHAMFDMRFLMKRWKCAPKNVSCTKIMAKLLDPDARNSLKTLLREFLSVEINKHEQVSDWMARDLTEEQLRYAANDVLHLASLARVLREKLTGRDLLDLAERCFDHLPTRVELELHGYSDVYDY
tara:strand:- start:3929 stop:4537 length:609 start_codon:yes stop_codon:yes gene_type:complete